MKLIVNAAEHEHRGKPTVRALLQELGAAARPVAVMINGEVVAESRRESTLLHEGDVVEVLTFAGGG